MPDSEIKPRARRKKRRLLKLASLMLIGIGACALFPNQTLNPVARRIAPTAASWAGWDLQLEGLSGAPWGTWKLQGLALQPEDGEQALQAVRFGQLNLQLDPGFWLSPGISQVQEVWARDGEIHYVAQETQATSDPEEDSAPLDLAEWPRLDLADCSLLLQRPGVDELHLQGLRLGLKNPARPGDARSLGWKVESATHREVAGSEQSYALDGLLTLLGTQLHIQELNLIDAAQGQVQLQAQLDLTRLAQPRGTFSVQCSEWSVPEIGRLTARTEGALLDTGIELTSLDAQSGNSTVLRLEQVSVPWPVDGTPWTDSLLPGIQGQVVAGGADLEAWLTRFGGEAPAEGQEWPLGSYLLEAQVIDGVVTVQQARVTLESPNWPAPVMVSAKGSLALDTRRAGETRIDGLLSVGQGKWAPQVGTQLEWPSITGGFAYSGAWPSGSGHFELHPSDWILSSPDQPDVAMNWSGRCDVEQGQIQLKSLLGRFGTAGQSAELPGELTLRGMLASVEQWMQSPSDAPLQLQADLTLHRLAPLRAVLPDLRRIEGTAQGQLSMGGSLADPKLRGSVQATADSVRFTWGETLSQVSAHMNWLDSNTGTFGLLGQYGGAPVDIVGNMAMGKGQPTWDATLQTKDFPLLRTPDARIRADGNLSAQGQGATFDVKGDVYLTHGRLHRDFDLAGSLLSAVDGLKGSPGSGAQPEVEGELLEFQFPENCQLHVGLHTNQPVDLISDLGRSSLEIEGALIGRAGRLYPEGTVVLNGGRISLPGSSLAWKQGVVLLPKGGGPPTIEAQGTTRLSGHDVLLRIHGPLQDPFLDLSSTPSRPDYDLLILLLTGELPQGRDWSRTTESLSIYLAKDVLKRWLGSEAGDGEGLFDRFEFTTGREVSESGLGTLEAMFRLNGDASGQGKALWITAERDRYEDVNFGLRFVLRPR